MMKLLLHTCCAPCLLSPFERLQDNKLALFYYNPNIHPFEEFNQRLAWVEQFAEEAKTDLITYHYNPDQYLNKVAFDTTERCEKCYELRLKETARVAQMKGFDTFTSTLLVSPYQKHELIIEMGTAASKKFDIPFYYEDFRPYYKDAQKTAKELGIYRQKYCGCKFSLEEREAELKARKTKVKE
ncbi:MAG: epoxyqueuosine reductase QueH [Actinobacteria bacterium]|nr:MAG: epoxyqueuosine reductase QueH [Actinomycetota bacterium]